MTGRLHRCVGALALVWLAGCDEAPLVQEEAGADASSLDASPVVAERDVEEGWLLSGRVTYDVRLPGTGGWSDIPEVRAGAGLRISVFHGTQLIVETTTSELSDQLGEFQLEVLAGSPPPDRLLVEARATDATGATRLLVADPGLPASAATYDPFDTKPNAHAWTWEFPIADLQDDGTIQIDAASGSAAVHVFTLLRRSDAFARAQFGTDGLTPTLVWLGTGNHFTCGSCTVSEPVQVLDAAFEHQIWLDGSSDERYWADSVTYHEIGHALMGSVSSPLREGGLHFFGRPTHPGQAYGEGWATFFSSFMRDDPTYLDRQGGQFVRFDLATRTYAAPSRPWLRPTADKGLAQLLDENEVAALLWGLSRVLDDPGDLFAALAAPSLRNAPFSRGYSRRIWSDPNYLTNYEDTGEPHPLLADLLDALRCGGAPAATLDGVTDPAEHYPYPSAAPLCPDQ